MEKKREAAISSAIQRAICLDAKRLKRTILAYILAFFSLWRIKLVRVAYELFKLLRTEVWKMDEEDYKRSFQFQKGKSMVHPMGDLGYSGSTFFRTANSKFLIKSLPRHFEHSFFKTELLIPYADYMTEHPNSLLVRITDFLASPFPSIGALLRLTPTHHIIMENVLCDRPPQSDEDSSGDKWETYDLKPIDYFYPERDLLPATLVSDDVRARLVDTFEDKIHLTKSQFADLRRTIDQDTAFLQSVNTVDYSLFLVRFPANQTPGMTVARKDQWREGVTSTDGRWKYRMVLLDYFWAKHKLRAQALTGVVQTFNVVGRFGPMSITTTAEEYREKFLQMLDGMVQLHD